MDDAPIRVFLLCDADECASNEALKEIRGKSTIKELEREYENWINLFGKTTEISQNELQNELPRVQSGLTQFIGYRNGITAYVDKDHMWFSPLNLI
ncbi:hypothetical protein [Desulfosporosinus sp. BG]|uniref:hypothetical protein n=1 Tax=Desulfosporosinus sp. BG TaxID=1633135 RepID=UPI00083A0F17|nr:hypothetical protein [Desulfosporosinus sp. BG]ODA39315.1 hypothetical protein DSBG_3919 [Desulfosporosinus sp. BG]